MKNQTKSSRRETAELQAKKAINRIQNWTEKNYPRLAEITRSRLIIECLIEMAEERKYLATHK
ncbi:MAG TPA: hypothetical protein VGC29_05395 [Flavisolibacter sp.]